MNLKTPTLKNSKTKNLKILKTYKLQRIPTMERQKRVKNAREETFLRVKIVKFLIRLKSSNLKFVL